MIRETTIDKSLNRLLRHFGQLLIARPPASAATLAQIEARVGPLPRDLVIFLTACDGLHLNLAEAGYATQFCTTQDILPTLTRPQPPAPPPEVLPIRCDPAGRDWLVLDQPPMHGVVIRWDPGTHGEQLIASSFGTYFDAWSRYLTQVYTSKGTPVAGKRRAAGPPAFDAAYVQKFDPALCELCETRGAKQYFARLELMAAGAEDFE